MDKDYGTYEIVKIIPDFRLLDAKCTERNYCTNHGEALASGYYVVSWPDVVQIRQFNEQAAFHGPFKYRKQALTFLYVMRKHKYRLIMSPQKRPFTASDVNRLEGQKVA